jgi:aminoglycoside 6'-N-acetyltransferase I
MTAYHIITLTEEAEALLAATAQALFEGFATDYPDAWPTLEEALEEVRDSLAEDRISRVAVSETGQVLGWVGAIEAYDGFAWELHPLVVAQDYRKQGIGRALVLDIEAQVRQRGAGTLFLGTDDETGRTSAGNVDLYPNIWEHIARLQNLADHPFSFYQRLGYHVYGILPDANGPGKPDILMAKRLT